MYVHEEDVVGSEGYPLNRNKVSIHDLTFRYLLFCVLLERNSKAIISSHQKHPIDAGTYLFLRPLYQYRRLQAVDKFQSSV